MAYIEIAFLFSLAVVSVLLRLDDAARYPISGGSIGICFVVVSTGMDDDRCASVMKQ